MVRLEIFGDCRESKATLLASDSDRFVPQLPVAQLPTQAPALWDTNGHMDDRISRIIIVGGGAAGWLTAGVIAAEHRIDSQTQQPFELLLIESPDVPTIGVGEGTWPSMRATLQRIGLSETDFIRECDASFKQGTYFRDWRTGSGDTYSHQFTVPTDYANTNLAPHWLKLTDAPQFADAVTPQTALFADCLAPKQITTPEYAFLVNYAYHLDAGKFAERQAFVMAYFE